MRNFSICVFVLAFLIALKWARLSWKRVMPQTSAQRSGFSNILIETCQLWGCWIMLPASVDSDQTTPSPDDAGYSLFSCVYYTFSGALK